MLLAVRVRVEPAQIGELLVKTGVAGFGFTVTLVFVIAVHPLEFVTVTEYVPVFEVVVFEIFGF